MGTKQKVDGMLKPLGCAENPGGWDIGREFIAPLIQDLERCVLARKERLEDLDDLQDLEMLLCGMGYPDQVASFNRAMAWLQVRRLDKIRTSIRRGIRRIAKKGRDLAARLDDPTTSQAAADAWRSELSVLEHSVVEPFIEHLRNLKLELENRFPPEILTPGEPNRGEAKEQPESTPRPRRRGRKLETDPKEDRKIAEAWATKRYKDYDALATAKHLKRHEIKKALDRHRKRSGKPGKA